MSNWIKITDDLYGLPATPDPVEVVSLSALEAEIFELQEKIDSIKMIEIPAGASEEVVMAINEKNGNIVATEIIPIQSTIEQKQQLLSELNKL